MAELGVPEVVELGAPEVAEISVDEILRFLTLKTKRMLKAESC